MRTSTLDILRAKLADARDQLELREHDVDRLLAADQRFRERLLVLLDTGKIALARGLIRWGLR